MDKMILSVISAVPFLDRCLPNHVAIVMDGNRRYAKSNNISFTEGHSSGYETFLKSFFIFFLWFFKQKIFLKIKF